MLDNSKTKALNRYFELIWMNLRLFLGIFFFINISLKIEDMEKKFESLKLSILTIKSTLNSNLKIIRIIFNVKNYCFRKKLKPFCKKLTNALQRYEF